MSNITISKSDYTALTMARRATRSKKEYTRLTAILDLADGMKLGVVCAALRVDEATIWRWRGRFEDKGVAGLFDPHYDSRNRHLTEAQEAGLDDLLSDKITRDAKTVAALIKGRFGVEYKTSGAAALMRRLGYSWHQPYPRPAKKVDVEVQEKALAEAEQLRKKVGDNRFYYLDAVHPAWGADTACGWIKKGRRHPLRLPARRTRLNVHGALSAAGELTWREDKTIDHQSTIALFESLLARHPGNERIGAICDGGSYYHEASVKAWLVANPRFTLYRLPPYSPNLNKVERLWGLMKRRALTNAYHAKFADFSATVYGFLNNLDAYKDDVATLLAAPCHIIAN